MVLAETSMHDVVGMSRPHSSTALGQPIADFGPDFLLCFGADGKADMPGWGDYGFAVLRGDQVVEWSALGAWDQIIAFGHDVHDWTGDVLEVHDVLADGQSILGQEILLVEIFDELAVDFAGDGDVVVEPHFRGEEIVDEFIVVGVLKKVDRFFDQVSHRVKEQEAGLQEFRRTVSERIDKLVHVEIVRARPEIEQALAGGEIDPRGEQEEVFDFLLVQRGEDGAHGAAHAVTQYAYLGDPGAFA